MAHRQGPLCHSLFPPTFRDAPATRNPPLSGGYRWAEEFPPNQGFCAS